MRLKRIALVVPALVAGVWMVTTVQAQVRSRDANVAMMDNCSTSDPAYGALGGCPEDAPFPGSRSFRGDVPLAELLELLFSPLAPADHVIGHPSWRNEPSYISAREGQNVRVSNRGGRVHTFTEVEDFGGGFVPLLNGAMATAPECANPATLTFVPYGGSTTVTGLESGLHKFQCCIHPWMRATIRIE
jgi:plastocyanin